MATANINTYNIVVHQDNNDSNHNGDTMGQATTAADGFGACNATTNFNLRVEQNKIPKFFGQKSKDTISAMDFIHQLEDLAKTNK
jgi:hypothetical protein